MFAATRGKPRGTVQASSNKKAPRYTESAWFTFTALGLLGVLAGLISMLLGAAHYGTPMFLSYFSSPLLVLLNILPTVLICFLVYFATGRAWAGFTVSSFLTLLLSVIGFFKIQIRGDAFTAADLSLIGETNKIITAYKLSMDWRLYIAAAFFAGGTVFSALVLRRRQRGAPRIIVPAVIIPLMAALFVLVYASDPVYDNLAGNYDVNLRAQTEGFIARGFVYPFLHSAAGQTVPVPEGYDEQSAESLLDEYSGQDEVPAADTSPKVNIICVMLESYSDLSEFDGISFIRDVYAPLRRLRAESVYGTLIDNVFAGNTIDTERLFLTGFTKLPEFSKPVNSYVWRLKQLGYYTEGLHAGDGWFYERDRVNKFLGFDNYYFLEDYEYSDRTDSFFLPEVLKLYRDRDKDKPYFSFNLSYQNHGAYASDWIAEPIVIEQGGLTREAYFILNNYLTGIYDTTMRIEQLTDALRYDPEPVVVAFFGDHMPWLGNMDSVYGELNINVDASTEEGFYNRYSTPFLIWANNAAKAGLDSDFRGYAGSFSPCFLMNRIFLECGLEGDAYMKAADTFFERADVISTSTGLFREDGKLTFELTEDSRRLYGELRILGYYRYIHFLY